MGGRISLAGTRGSRSDGAAATLSASVRRGGRRRRDAQIFARPRKLPTECAGEIVAHADDGAGVEALVGRIGGTTVRLDGSIYHITWSLGPNRKAKESNDMIRERGWASLREPVPIRLQPRLFSDG